MVTKKYYFNKDDKDLMLKSPDLLALTEEQINEIKKPTPPSEIEPIKDESGNEFKSVKASYVKYKLNVVFGWNWNFKIISKEHYPASREILVHGKLTINSKKKIKREQFGSSFVEYKTKQIETVKRTSPVNLGFAYKAACSDCLKKCCAELGMFWDVYSGDAITKIKEENKPSYQEQKRLEKLDHFMGKCNTQEDIEYHYDKEFHEGKETEFSKELLNKHFERIGLIVKN